MVARSVCWRGSAVRAPPVSSRKRSSSRAAIPSTGSTPTRAAASSMARGKPSSRAQICATAARVRRGQRQSGAPRPGPLQEQLHRFVRGQLLQRRRVRWVGRGEGGHQIGALAGHPQAFAAGRQHAQVGAGRQQCRDQGGAGAEQVLAVVQHQEQIARAQERGQRGQQGLAPAARRRPARRPPPAAPAPGRPARPVPPATRRRG